MKKFWQSKTFWAGVSEAVAGVATLFTEMPTGASIGFIIAGVATIALRFATNTGLTK